MDAARPKGMKGEILHNDMAQEWNGVRNERWANLRSNLVMGTRWWMCHVEGRGRSF